MIDFLLPAIGFVAMGFAVSSHPDHWSFILGDRSLLTIISESLKLYNL
jgi:hypothetical protein